MNKKSGVRAASNGHAGPVDSGGGVANGGGSGGGHGSGPGGNPISAWTVDAGVPVSRYMTTDVAYLRDNMWVDAAVSFLQTRDLREAPVLDADGRPVGMLYVDDVDVENPLLDGGSFDDLNDEQSDRGVADLFRDQGLGSGFHLDGGPRVRVRDVMVPYVPEIAAETSIVAAAMMMRENQLGHVMVVSDDGRAAGVFAREDLVNWLVEETTRRPAPSTQQGLCLRDVMRPVVSIRRRATLTTARDLMTTHGLAELPVVDGGRVLGVITETEIVGMLNAHRDDDGWMQELLVEDVMVGPVLLGAPSDPIGNLRLAEAHGGCVLVAEHGRLIGVVTERDLAPAVSHAARGQGEQLSY
ncbi:MAG TPA: CBS domain-containing protein [Polyangia bacterium]